MSGRVGIPDVWRDEDTPTCPGGCGRLSSSCDGTCWHGLADPEGIMEDFETFEVAARYSAPVEKEAGLSDTREPSKPLPSEPDWAGLEELAASVGVTLEECVDATTDSIMLGDIIEGREEPNADLIGFEAHGFRVTGTPAWSNGEYVRVVHDDGGPASVRVAAQIRIAKEAR